MLGRDGAGAEFDRIRGTEDIGAGHLTGEDESALLADLVFGLNRETLNFGGADSVLGPDRADSRAHLQTIASRDVEVGRVIVAERRDVGLDDLDAVDGFERVLAERSVTAIVVAVLLVIASDGRARSERVFPVATFGVAGSVGLGGVVVAPGTVGVPVALRIVSERTPP